jgi:hypothetical protein
MATRIVLLGGESIVVANPVPDVSTALSSGDSGFPTFGRPGEGAPDVVVNPTAVLYLEHFEEQSPFIDVPSE